MVSDARVISAAIPAAGFARRLDGTIRGSKEVEDIGGRPAAAHVLERLAAAGIDRAVIALRRGKWDIPETLRSRHLYGVAVAYVVVDETPSPVHSLVPALRLMPHDLVALAFPDVLFEPRDAFAAMIDRQRSGGADVVLGLFATHTPERVDMVRLDDDGRPIEIVIKQPDQGLNLSWSIAVWSPRFTEFLLAYVASFDHAPAGEHHELQVGEVVQAAINNGLEVTAVTFDDGSYLDVGTPADLAWAREHATT